MSWRSAGYGRRPGGLYHAAAKKHFLWQVAYRVPAMNLFHTFDQVVEHLDILCTRCLLQEVEDIEHCLWTC